VIFSFGVIGFLDVRRRLRERHRDRSEQEAYYQVLPKHRLYVVTAYLSLLALLLASMQAPFPRRPADCPR